MFGGCCRPNQVTQKSELHLFPQNEPQSDPYSWKGFGISMGLICSWCMKVCFVGVDASEGGCAKLEEARQSVRKRHLGLAHKESSFCKQQKTRNSPGLCPDSGTIIAECHHCLWAMVTFSRLSSWVIGTDSSTNMRSSLCVQRTSLGTSEAPHEAATLTGLDIINSSSLDNRPATSYWYSCEVFMVSCCAC